MMLLRSFVPVLLIALAFFVTILQLVDLFDDIATYIDREIPFAEIFRVQALYIPKSLHFALPMGLLFAVSFTLGTLYSHNELIAVFGSGVSLRAFVVPLVIAGLAFSAGAFFFEEHVVISTIREKNAAERALLNVSANSGSNSNVTRLGSASRVLYNADFYNDQTQTLNGALFVERDALGVVTRVITARTARWTGSFWQVQSARFFERTDEAFVERYAGSEDLTEFVLAPRAFRRVGRDMDEMRLEEAWEWIEAQRSSGLPYREELTKYYERYSFAFTPLIVVLIATTIGGRFRKNILLMSLLVSLGVSVVYYVTQMVSGLLAYSGLLSPVFGAWAGVLLFVLIGLALSRVSRT